MNKVLADPKISIEKMKKEKNITEKCLSPDRK